MRRPSRLARRTSSSQTKSTVVTFGVLAGFGFILWRGFRIALATDDDFARYLAIGLTTMVVLQALINISVVLGMGPTKGFPLPMISSGGSSLLATMGAMGILMNVSEHS